MTFLLVDNGLTSQETHGCDYGCQRAGAIIFIALLVTACENVRIKIRKDLD